MSAVAEVQVPAREACFHCGLPVDRDSPYRVSVDGAWRSVCCAGCEAVAGAVLGQGLGDFYRLREDGGGARGRPANGEDFSLYDDPRVQEPFVVAGAGYREATLLLEGVRCPACVWLNERAIGAVPGVLEVQANFSTRRVRVRWDSSGSLSAILGAIARVGYRAVPHGKASAEAQRRGERRDALWRLFVAVFGMMQVMMYAFPEYIALEGELSADAAQLMRWASFVLTVPVVAYSAAPFFAGAWRSLRLRSAGMDVPVALGIAIAFGASVVSTVRGSGEVYYDSVTMFVFLLLAGRFLETLARQRSARSLDHLEGLVPELAWKLDDFPASLSCSRVPALTLRPGDLALVRPGESVPADGLVAQGHGSVSEALLTGESRPLAKNAGDGVIGGSVNLSDALVIRVGKVGAQSMLGSMRALIERAAAERPRFVQASDRAASLFVLLVMALALSAALAWMTIDPSRALVTAIAVLVATCPCAFALATPAAQSVAAGELVRLGVVATRGHAMETLAGATDIVLDKTGTVTRGELRLVEIAPLGSLEPGRLLAIAASMEAASEHPIGRALVAAAGGIHGEPASYIRHVTGSGVEAVVDGVRFRLGTRTFAKAGAVPCAGVGDTVVWLSDGNGALGAFRFADEIRPEAARAIHALRTLGLTVHLLSGDAKSVTDAVARRLGITAGEGGARPERKRQYVRELQTRGRRVAMVGDGVNDAPVLAQADVSLAMGGGTRLAQTGADAVIVSGDLLALPRAVGYARRMLRVVRQNIAWAFAYNLLVLPLAVSGHLSPWAAAIGMSASSLVVVLNALRLQSHPERA